jgi:hypothetical protein
VKATRPVMLPALAVSRGAAAGFGAAASFFASGALPPQPVKPAATIAAAQNIFALICLMPQEDIIGEDS